MLASVPLWYVPLPRGVCGDWFFEETGRKGSSLDRYLGQGNFESECQSVSMLPQRHCLTDVNVCD